MGSFQPVQSVVVFESARELARWARETAFLRLTVERRGEIDTLGYPRAALFGFAVAAVAFNILAVVKATLALPP